MKLRFEVDQAEAFRQGVDCPKSIVSVDVNPADLDKETRELIAKRMVGIDVAKLRWSSAGAVVNGAYSPNARKPELEPAVMGREGPQRVIAKLPTFEALVEAVKADEQRVQDDPI